MNKKVYESIRKSFEMSELEKTFLRELGWYYHNLYAPDIPFIKKWIQEN